MDYVLVEYKFGSSPLGKTLDGLQMSDGWLTGVKTNYNRILESVSGDLATAADIGVSLRAGRVEKWLVHTDPLGNVTVALLDSQGKLIAQPLSRLFPGMP